MSLYTRMLNNGIVIKNAQDALNTAIKNGAYVYITLADGTEIHLDRPIQINSIEATALHSVADGYYKAEQINLNK